MQYAILQQPGSGYQYLQFYEVFQASEVHVASGFKNRPKCRHYLQPECKMLASSILALMQANQLSNKDYDRFVIGPFISSRIHLPYKGGMHHDGSLPNKIESSPLC